MGLSSLGTCVSVSTDVPVSVFASLRVQVFANVFVCGYVCVSVLPCGSLCARVHACVRGGGGRGGTAHADSVANARF